MKKILFVTVGGSPQPIITAVETLQPERVIFVCSDGDMGTVSLVLGTGTPCEIRRGREVLKKLPNLPTVLKLGERFDPDRDVLRLPEPDEPAECYRIISEAMAGLAVEPRDIAVDYTGGTKSMSASLVMAAQDRGIDIFVTTAERKNKISVEGGETTSPVFTSSINVLRLIDQLIPAYLKQFHYPAAIKHIDAIMRSAPLLPESKHQLRRLRDFCRLFDAWDRFDHAEACDLAEAFMKLPEFREAYGMKLKQIIASRRAIDPAFDSPVKGKPGHGYEIVEDLLLNAERRAVQERFDDAVGRLYRALELTVQIRLWNAHNIPTGAVPRERLPADWPAAAEKTVKLSLLDSYRFLSLVFPDDPVGQVFAEREKKLLNSLQIRNHSLFAHGFKPVSRGDYEGIHSPVNAFIRRAVPEVGEAAQFPAGILDGVR